VVWPWWQLYLRTKFVFQSFSDFRGSVGSGRRCHRASMIRYLTTRHESLSWKPANHLWNSTSTVNTPSQASQPHTITDAMGHLTTYPNFLYMLPVAVAQSSSDGNVLYHVFLVLWMTSCFHTTEENRPESKTTHVLSSSPGGGRRQTILFGQHSQVAALGVKSAVSDCILFQKRTLRIIGEGFFTDQIAFFSRFDSDVNP